MTTKNCVVTSNGTFIKTSKVPSKSGRMRLTRFKLKLNSNLGSFALSSFLFTVRPALLATI